MIQENGINYLEENETVWLGDKANIPAGYEIVKEWEGWEVKHGK